MTASVLQLVALFCACGAAAAGLVLRDERLRTVAMAAALVLAAALMTGQVWGDPRLEDLSPTTPVGAALLLGALLVLAALTVGFVRWPGALAVAAITVIAVRVPLTLAEEQVNLLVPLYGVVAAGAAARIWAMLKGQLRTPPADPRLVSWLKWVLAALLVLYALQSAYSLDVDKAIETACFFLVPFSILFILLTDLRWSGRLIRWCLRATVVVALIAALMAITQFATRELWLNPDLLASNQIHMYFRVNAFFFDPNILARYLALVIVALGAVLVYMRRLSATLPAIVIAVPLLVALALTLSLTGALALIAGLIVVVGIRFGLITMVATGLITVALAFAFLSAGGADRSNDMPDRGIEAETGGRVDLFQGGLDLGLAKPLGGWGSGSFGAAFGSEIESARTTVSHSEPATYWAEQGAVGALVYLVLLGVSLALMIAVSLRFGDRSSRSRGHPRPRRLHGAAAAAVTGGYVAIIAHSLGYANFLTDPATWALLALACGLLCQGVTSERPRPDARRQA